MRARRILSIRSRLLQCIRRFFIDRDFIEVETPVRIPAPAPELHIDAEPSGSCYLRTSPELHMKRLLVSGCSRIFQMGPCFRQGECGHLHNPEYTMLEWYRTDADYMDVLDDTKALLASVFEEIADVADSGGVRSGIEVAGDWEILTVEDAFLRFAGWNPVKAFDADRFDMELVTKVEPALCRDRPVILKDYPAAVAALAACRAEPPAVAERWELFLGGMELANAFSELTDAEEQRRRFAACGAARKAAGRDVYPLDEAFLSALDQGMPRSGGVALGVDRLMMLLTGAASIEQVRAFCR